MSKKLDIIGKKYGKMTVLSEGGRTNFGKVKFICKCDCGNTKEVIGSGLLRGTTTSCGCVHRAMISALGKSCGDGMPMCRLKKIFKAMNTRCYNKNSTGYKYWGGKGVTICDEWKDNYKAFHDWAIVNGYRDDLSIDRIDHEMGYIPSNCRWATDKEQANNMSSNHVVYFNFEQYTMTQFAELIGTKRDAIKHLFDKGMSAHEIAYKFKYAA
jgi:hypothetical protein